MGNTTDNEEGGEPQKDEIPRDTQVNRQYLESPSNNDVRDNQDVQANQINQDNQANIITESPNNQINQKTEIQINELNQMDPNQINQLNQMEQTNQNYIMMQGGVQQNSTGQGGVMQYEIKQGAQEIQPNIEQVQYEVNQQYNNQGTTQYNQPNKEMQNSQGYEIHQDNQGYEIHQDNQGYEIHQDNQGYEINQDNQGVQDNHEYYANEEGENQEMEQEEGEGEGEEEYVEGEEVEIIEGDGDDIIEGEEIAEGENQVNQEEPNQIEQQQDNNQIKQESRSYQINRDGKVYKVNEEIKQYNINQGGDNNYQIKKETKTTTTIENNNVNSPNYPNYPNNNLSQVEGRSSQIKTSIKKSIKSLPKDSLQKVYIQSSRFTNDDYIPGRYTQYYSDIPRYMSFQKSGIKQTSQVHSNVNVVKTEDLSELVEIPRSQYEQYAGRETIFIGGGMDTGEYKFRGQGIVITQAEVPKKIIITEEDILKEINRRKNKPKKEKKRRYEILDKFYNIIEFDGKPIRKIEKVEQQQKQQYEYAQQEQYYSSSKGKVGYQFSSKESQSQQILNPQLESQSNQMQYQQSQQVYSQQYESQPQYQAQSSSQAAQMNVKYSQNQNIDNSINISSNDNNNFKTKKLVLNAVPSDNYSKNLLEQINKLRTSPQSYISVIEEAKKNIITDKRGRLVYNGKIKIGLNQGEAAFDNAISYLKGVKPVEKLIFNPYMAVELPKTENEIKYKNDLDLKVENMINNGIYIKSYWRDVIKDPEISFLMMIVDDNGNNSGMRRNDLLDPNMKYIGISSTEINGNFICYITLSTDE
jgi:hypothetical protein